MRHHRRTPPLVMSARPSDEVARHQLGWHIRNCALSPFAAKLERAMMEHLDFLRGDRDESAPHAVDRNDATASGSRDLRRRRQALRAALRQYAVRPPSDDSLDRNAIFARDEFGLDQVDTEILLLRLRCEANSRLDRFATEVVDALFSPVDAVAALLGIDPHEARLSFGTDGPLIATGLLCLRGGGYFSRMEGLTGCLGLAPPLRKVIQGSYGSREAWAAALVGQPLTTALTWKDFEHLGTQRELAAHLMSGAARAGARGINLLLHGPVGTGKTEFAKVLASQAGLSVWSVGEADEEGDEPTRDERLAALKLACTLLSKRRSALILLDEAEDVLASGMPFFGPFAAWGHNQRHARSKIYLNRILEQNPIPIIWTCNETGGIDPAVLRRMAHAIEVTTPNRPVRTRIMQRVCEAAGLPLDAEAADRLAGRYLVPPAVAANAARAAAIAGGGEADVETAIGGVLQLLGIGPCVADADARDFAPEFVNCQDDLADLIERLVRPDAARQWSLCVHGAPGTGKSHFARHLAARLGMEVLQQRASDLLSCWVGGSEKQIAAAFQAARARRAILVIDEADSLLSDRRDAVRSWEVTQVNEMLTWMESHPLPFVCTTNLMERLDQASLRRFTLKLRFDPLTPRQAALAFRRSFGMAAPRPLADGLTPGDFATVRRKHDLLLAPTPSVLADWLDEEVKAKGARIRRIGFDPGLD